MQVLAVVVTIWLISHSFFIFDTGYRTSLRALWKVKHGPANYTRVLTPGKMAEVASDHYPGGAGSGCLQMKILLCAECSSSLILLKL